MTHATQPPPDYGIDAPGLVRIFFSIGIIALIALTSLGILLPPTILRPILITPTALLAAYTLGMGCLMIYGSKVYKVNNVARLFDSIRWTGNETVLDVGCGAGLLLIAAAKRLTTGRAIGVDIWSPADQSHNNPERAIENARREGVQDKVTTRTGDMRELPFPDATFDIILSHWAIHNLPDRRDRQTALREMVRTLKPGGQLLIVDIANHAEYVSELSALGVINVKTIRRTLLERAYGIVSFGSFLPYAVFASKQDAGG